MKRISGYLAKSEITSVGVGEDFSERIQPMWLHQKPLIGECRSRSVSEKRWCSRWLPAHHSGPFCIAIEPPKAKMN